MKAFLLTVSMVSEVRGPAKPNWFNSSMVWLSNRDRALNRNHRQTDVIIMDFAKAFDKVPHRRLLYKLDYYGIRGSSHKWITSWLSGRSQKVVLDGQASDPVPVLSGVPQGSVLGPILHPYHESQIGQVEKVQRTAARWTCRRWRNTSSVGDMLDDLEWPSLETRREQSSLTFFYKIHSGTVSLDKDKYLTPAPNLRRTRASHESQYTRYFAYSDARKNSFFPQDYSYVEYPMWNSLPSSVVSSKTIEEFKAQI